MRVFYVISFVLLMSLGLTPRARACTALSFPAGHGPIYAVNLDLVTAGSGLVVVNRRGIAKKNFRKSQDGSYHRWVSSYGSITFNIAGRGFAWGGMNEAGLVVGMLQSMSSRYPKVDDRVPFDSGAWTQYLLDNYSTVGEALEVTKTLRLVADGIALEHFFIVDALGGAAVLEYKKRKVVVYEGDSLQVRALTNMPYARATKALRRGGPRWWWSNPGRSAERFALAADYISSFRPGSAQNAVDHAFSALLAVGDQYTKWSVVYDLGTKAISFRSISSPNIKRLALSEFDFSCKKPMLLLDVDTKARGNIRQAFAPYTRDYNLRFFTVAMTRLGIFVSNENANDLMSIYEGFTCALPSVAPRPPSR